MQKTLKILLCSLGFFLSFQASAETDWSKTEREIDRTKSSLELKSADGHFSIGFMGYLQQDTSFNYNGTSGNKDLNFDLNAARLGFYGSAFHPSLTYFIQTGFENDGGLTATRTSRYLRDYYLNYEAHRRVQLRIGKFGMPFGRQNMVLGSHQQFTKVNSAVREFTLGEEGKDVGFMAHNGRNETVEWAAALVTNGLVARVGYNHGGIDGYELTDFNGGPLRFAVALNGAAQFGNVLQPSFDNISTGVDFLVKVKHFSANGMFNHNFTKAGTNPGVNRLAGGLDMGYLMHGRYEPVVRYSWLQGQGTAASAHEVLAGLNYYIYGQHLKVQGYAGADFGADTAWKLGAQFQFAL